MWRNGWEAVRSVDGIAKMQPQLAIPSIEHTDTGLLAITG